MKNVANTFRKIYKKTGSTGTSSDYQLVGNVGVDGVELDIMKGATTEADGEIGLVPKPLTGQQDYILTGSGNWISPNDFLIKTDLSSKVIKKIYTNITTDQFGFFNITELSTDIRNGYTVIQTYVKDAARGSDGPTCFPVFSLNNIENITSYGYMYFANGSSEESGPSTVKSATNITMVAILMKLG